MKVIYQQDSFTLDAERITDETHPDFGDMTVFHGVVIASEIVQKYKDGLALKTRDELEAYAWTVNGGWVILGAHPSDGIISERDQVSGRTVNSRYVKNLIDPKTGRTNRAGVRADVQIFNNKVPPQLLADMKNGLKQDVSIGFFFSKDETPGVVTDGILKDTEYDYIQRNMFHNHLAAGLDDGRCPSPLCGLGADEIKKLVVGDPFAGFSDFSDCQQKIQARNPELSAERVDKICGALKARSGDSKVEDDLMVKSATILRMLLEEELESLRGERDALKETKEWWKIDWKNDEKLSEIFPHLTEEIRNQITEAGLCPTCGEDEEHEGECPEGEHMVDGECVPKDDGEESKGDVKETNPGFAPGKAEQECPEGKEWNAEQKACVEIKDFNKKDKLTPDAVFERYDKISKTP